MILTLLPQEHLKTLSKECLVFQGRFLGFSEKDLNFIGVNCSEAMEQVRI